MLSDTNPAWPLAKVRTYRKAAIYVRCGQGTRKPRDGWFARTKEGRTLRSPTLAGLRALVNNV